MIQFDSRYFNNAHRISDVSLASTVTTLYDGQWLMLDSNGEMVISDGSKKSYLTISSKYGNPADNINRQITEGPAGRDNVTSTGRVSVLIGPYRIATDQYETGSYSEGDALKVSSNGKLEAWDSANDSADAIVAWVWAPPAEAGDPMTIVHE